MVRLSDMEMPFLYKGIMEDIQRSTNIEKLMEDTLSNWAFEQETLERMTRSLAKGSNTIKQGYAELAAQAMERGHQAMEDDQYHWAEDAFKEVASIYAALNHHRRFSEAVSSLAVAHYEAAEDKDKAKEESLEMLRPIDQLISHHLARRHVRKGPGKNPKAVRKMKKRRKAVREMKKLGKFKPRQRWPRSKWRNYHTSKQDFRTALNLIYIKAEAYKRLDEQEKLEGEYQRALKVLDSRYHDNPQYLRTVLARFENIRGQ